MGSKNILKEKTKRLNTHNLAFLTSCVEASRRFVIRQLETKKVSLKAFLEVMGTFFKWILSPNKFTKTSVPTTTYFLP